MRSIIESCISESIATKQNILENRAVLSSIEHIAEAAIGTLSSGGKLLICGNGGSASDSIHFAGEIVGRFQKERPPWSAIALNSDVSTMTAIANDYGYDKIFERQLRGLIEPGDLFVGISSSGNSSNVLNAAVAARELGGKTAALLGKRGGFLVDEVDHAIVIPSDTTARIQESHIMCIHIICEIIEERLA